MAGHRIKSGKLWAFIGRSRSGKTQAAEQQIRKIPCVLIWDIEEQYTVTHRARTQAELVTLVKHCAGKRCRIGYTGRLEDFNFFCKVAFWFARRCGELGKPSGVVFEETADVTTPAKAPEHYGIILRRGLKYGVSLFAITQRPAESDKTAIGNSSVVHVCALKLPSDRAFVSKLTGVPLDVITDLEFDQDSGRFGYVTVDDNKGTYQRGLLTFQGNKPKFAALGPPVKL